MRKFSEDELGLLTDAFNHMLSRIQELRERAAGLKDIQRKLRHRLDDRNAKIKRLQEERLRQKARIP